MTAFVDHDIPSLAGELARRGHNPSNAARLLRAFYDTGGATDFSTRPIPRIARALCDELTSDSHRLRKSRVLARRVAADGTVKLLLGFADGAPVETVMMPSHRADRSAGCVSSQVGCAMGCDFCASTKSGLTRDLDAGEIVEQFLHLRAESLTRGRRLCSLVFMGMGEPLLNLDAVTTAIRRIADPSLGALGWRHVTVSTVGIVPGIERLAEENLGVQLALSLHAPDDATRRKLVPAARKWGIAEIITAARRYQDRSGRVVTIEYCLLAGVNDSDDQAAALADLVRGWRVHVNLIPHNFIGSGLSGAVYHRPDDARVEHFARVLRGGGAVVHLRRPRGDDVDAACGQLRQRYVQIGTTDEHG
jgi:23S rRNA (adenine2503-C2)-methyltransferase